jgi:hypothetical protein
VRLPVANYVALSNSWQRAFRAVLFEDQNPRVALAQVGAVLADSSRTANGGQQTSRAKESACAH